MDEKYTQLIKYLLEQNNEITSSQLAQHFSITSRTIKNYISVINKMSSDRIIISTRNGYIINKSSAVNLLNKNDSFLPQNYIERSKYIIKEFLIKHKNTIDIYDLCDQLYISYSTIKSDITKMNKEYAPFNINFHYENDNIIIDGDEKSKRKLISNILYDELNQNFMNLDIIQNSFKDYPISIISNILSSAFNKFHYYINDFSFMNLILHTTILIDRVKYKKFLNLNKESFDIEEREKSLIDDISCKLEENFSIKLNSDERFELYLLCISSTNNVIHNTSPNIQEFIGEKLLYLTDIIISSVNDIFLVDLYSDSFIKPFTLHLKNLLLRIRYNISNNNPLLDSIKKQYPGIYEIAVHISFKLKELLNIKIPEDEIAFIAIHIGAEIERQRFNNEKMSCVLLCPKYLGIENDIYNKLMFDFGNDINIIACISYPEQLKGIKFDLLITTVKFEDYEKYENVIIPPFADAINKFIILNAIESIQKKKKNKVLRENFDRFFSEKFFFIDQHFFNEKETIEALGNKLNLCSYVHSDFIERVLQREAMSSTAFGRIAIPHSVSMNSLKTNICVVLDKDGIPWGNTMVNVVFLISINKFEKNIFRELYESLISCFDDNNKIIDNILCCNDFQSFKKYILANLH